MTVQVLGVFRVFLTIYVEMSLSKKHLGTMTDVYESCDQRALMDLKGGWGRVLTGDRTKVSKVFLKCPVL